MAVETEKDKVKVRILVVDDEIDLEHLMLQRLRREVRRGRYEFEFAHNGQEALDRIAESSKFDIVLSDINMPVMDGLTMLSQIPAVDPDIRAVMVSAYGDMENIRTAMNRGAFDFVTKPIDFMDLKITIERTIDNLKLWREALISRDRLVAIQNELVVAMNIQQSILPKSFPIHGDFDIYAHMVSARSVGGDFYDVYELDDGRIGLVIADVSGKGVPAALFMMACRTLMKAYSVSSDSPAEVLGKVNQMLSKKNESMTFVTLLYGIYNSETRELLYANGGHNHPVLVSPGNATSLLPSTEGIAVGIVPDIEYKENTITLETSSLVTLYTDGVNEAEREGDELFGMERFFDVLCNNSLQNAEDAVNRVFQSVSEFVGDSAQSDDITCLVLHVD